MNSGHAEREKAHREATKKAAGMTCVCGIYGCVPAHYPRHRGSGGRWENPWDESLWVGLCPKCHDILDRRHGTSPAADFAREMVIRQIERGPLEEV